MYPDDLEALRDDELVTALRSVEIEHRLLAARRAQLVEALDRRRIYRHDGHPTVHGLVRTIARCPTAESKHLLQVGRLLRRVPAVAAATHAGEVGVAQLQRMARAAAHPRCGSQFDDVAEVMVDAAKTLKFSEFDTVGGRWETLADVDGANQRADASHHRRDAWIAVLGDGFHGGMQGGALAGLAMKEILDRHVQIEWERDWQWTRDEYGDAATPALMPRTDPQRRADALYAIFNSAAAAPADARPPEPVVNVVTDAFTFCRMLAIFFGVEVTAEMDAAAAEVVPVADRRCETSTGVPVAPNEMFVAALVGSIRRVVVDSRGVVIDMGRRQRLFTGDARSAALMGWRRCCWPGCEVPAVRCHTDHLTDWQHGGTTSPQNGAAGCPHHNWLKQNRGFTTRRDAAGRIHVYRPDGSEVA